MSWIDSNTQVNEGATVGNCKINRLFSAHDSVLLAFAEQDLKHALDLFSTACDQAGMNISTEKTDIY